VLPDAMAGGRRSALGDGDLQTREDTMKYCKEKCLDGLRRCARASQTDGYQRWEAGSPRCAGFVLARWRYCGSLVSDCVGLAAA
jgi:hypothetical protein